MTFEECFAEICKRENIQLYWDYANDIVDNCRRAFNAGAASRDAYIERLETGLLQVRKALCGDIHNTDDLLDLIASRDAEIAELVAALEDNWNCNPCETTRQQKAFDVAQSVLAKVRKS